MYLCVAGQVTEGEKTLRTQTTDTIQGWKTGGLMSVTLAQTSLTNWAAGGQNSVSVNGILSLFANYRKDKSVWNNSLDIGYGLLKQGEDEAYKKLMTRLISFQNTGRRPLRISIMLPCLISRHR